MRLALWAVLAVSVSVGPVRAQLPGGSPTPSPSAEADKLPTRKAIEERVEAATEELGRRTPVPDGIPAAEAEERDVALQDVLRHGRRALGELDRRTGLQSDRARAEEAIKAWKGFDRKAPYPILLVDWYRDASASAKLALDGQRSVERMLVARIESARTALQSVAQKARAAQERIDAAQPPDEAARERWRFDAARWGERAAAAWMELAEVGLANARERSGRAAAELVLLDRQSAALRGGVTFTKEDLGRVLSGIETEQARLRPELAQGSGNATTAAAASAAAERALASAEAAGDAAKTAVARAVLARAKARADTADLWVECLRAQQEILDAEARNWQARFEFHQKGPKSADARRVRDDLMREAALLEQWQEFLRNKTDANATLISVAAEETADTNDVGLAKEGAMREGYYRRVDLSLHRLERLVVRSREEVEERIGSATLGERAAGAADSSRALFRRFWDYELFTAKDDVVVDGRTVRIDRGITVRKVVFAAVVLLGSYLLARLLGRLVERVALRRAGTPAGVAAALRHWVVAFGAVAAVFLAFVIAKIPLTAFAFLGGALAIGIGFGTQNLMTNFISGLILLFERPMRVGDIVQIAGETGTVVEVGLRASTLRRPDGAELVIPNRDFLEQTVVNSTLSDRRLRFCIKVGVDYGSPTRRVRELLSGVAKEHGEVLRQPEPLVFFEDFGSDALQFALYFWVDLARTPDPRAVSSDLRLMIDHGLNEAGIGISYPQRDVHLHTPAPLEIRMARSAKELKSEN